LVVARRGLLRYEARHQPLLPRREFLVPLAATGIIFAPLLHHFHAEAEERD
jgi:hypothetical protein